MTKSSRRPLECLTNREVAALVGGTPASDDALDKAMRHAAECDACRELLVAVGRVRGAEASRDPTEPTSDATSTPANRVVVKPGATLGRYHVGRELGRGGMGVVYEGYDPELARRVAIKVLHGGADVSKLARMSREAQAVAALSHPNVVQIFDVSLGAEPAFIVMEFVAGRTLREWADDERPHWRTVLSAYLQAARGLAAAHAAGLVHRDFKPGNAIIDVAGVVKVLDFGLARTDGEGSLSSGGDVQLPFALATLTATGVAVGTPTYMAPEQHRGERVDARADVYGLAVALYEALYDRVPFEARSLELLLLRKQDGPAREAPRSAVPEAIHAAILEALAYDPDARWPTMESFAGALTSAAPRRRPIAWVLAGIAAMALAAAAFVDTTPAVVDERPTSVAIDVGLATEAIDAIVRAHAQDPASGLGTALAATTLAAASGSVRVRAHAEIEVGTQLGRAHLWPLALGWWRQAIAHAAAADDDRAEAAATIRAMDALNELRQFSEARDVGHQARSLLARVGEDPGLLAALLAAEARALPDGHPDTIARYEQALAIRRANPGRVDPVALAATLNNLGATLGDSDDARRHALFSEALEIHERVQGHDHPETLVTALNLVVLDYELGNYDDCTTRGMRVHRTLPESEHEPRAFAAQLVAGCSIEVRATAQGLEWIDRALHIQAKLDADSTHYANMLDTKAVLLTQRGQWSEAEALLLRALVIHEAAVASPSWSVAHTRYKLAIIATERGDLERAQAYARRTLEEADVLSDRLGSLHARTLLAKVLVDRGHHAEALDLLAAHLDLPADAAIDPMYIANAKGVYARACWEAGDRGRAIELAHEALDAFARRPEFVAEHDELRIWLASRRSSSR